VKRKPGIGAVLGAAAASTAAYALLVRKWQLGFGATVEEILRPMPLDDRVEHPNHVTNRAITIRAAPEAIWPWLAQIGELPRGGFYSYVTVERILKMKVANADAILPEFQNPRVGEALDRSGGLIVQAVEPNRYIVLGPEPQPDLRVTWALALYPAKDSTTRLVSRCRAWLRPAIRKLFWFPLLDAGQLLMERKMLLEIRKRVERSAGISEAGSARAAAGR
jgi:hypothetical protein